MTEEQERTLARLRENYRVKNVPGTTVIRVIFDEKVEVGIAEDGRVISVGLQR